MVVVAGGSHEESTTAGVLFELVEQMPAGKLPDALAGMAAVASVRKTSKIMSTHWLCDIFGIQDARTLALTSALYFEHIALRLAERDSEPGRPKRLSAEVSAWYATGLIDESLCDNIRAVIRLRNEFVHNLYYDIANWDPLGAPFLGHRRPQLPQARHLRSAKNLVLVKVLLVEIYERLHEALPWLSFEDVPQAFRRRSSSAIAPLSNVPL